MSYLSISNEHEPLRKKAESQLAPVPPADAPARSAEELLHELRVYQTELETQNETLRQAQTTIEESRDRYMDLYDFAPVGYLTLTRETLISEINLAGAALLGEKRSKLIRHRFATLIAPEDSDRWHQIFMRALHHSDKQSCELVLQRVDGSRFHAQLDILYLVRNGDAPVMRLTITDIYRRKEADERYLKLFEEASDAIALTDAETGAILELNQALANLVGRDKSELIGKPQNILFPPDTYCPVLNILGQRHSDMHNTKIETKFITKYGNILDVAIKTSATTLNGRKMALWKISDITKLNQTQASERRTRHILDNTLDMIFIFSPDTLRFVYMNKGAIEGIGYSREELLQMSPPDVLLLIPEPECRAFIAPLISGRKKKLRFETLVKRKNGRDFPVEVQLQLVQEEDNNSLFVAIVRDITKRKFAENELRRQKNLMWQVIDMDPNMIFVRDEAGKYLLANQTLADFYGVPIRNLIGRKNGELNLDSQEISGFLVSDHEVIENRSKLTSTESATMPDGKQHCFLTVKRPLPQADGSVNVLGIAVDISDQKLSEVKLAESYKELQRLALYLENIRAEERAQIARNLHDEMGATLAALKMRVAWLASKLPGGLPHLSAEVEHISDLVSDGIRTVRQVVADLRPNLLDDVGLVAAVKDYVKKFRHDTEIECTLVLPEGEFTLNEDQSITVFRIIQESLSNVAKHAQASKVDILFAINGNWLLLKMRDDGIGFDPINKRQSYGLLGIKERALMIGGKATIVSTPGQGTQVSLSLPIFPSSIQSDLNPR